MRTRMLLLLLPLTLGAASAADDAGLDVAARATLPAPGEPWPEPADLRVTPAGDLLAVSRSGMGGGVSISLADPSTGAAGATFSPGLAGMRDADAVADARDAVLVAGWGTASSTERWVYAIWSLDREDGAVLGSRPVAEVGSFADTRAAFTADGTLYVLVERPEAAVDLLAVDVATGTTTTATAVSVGSGSAVPWMLAVADDGATVAAVLTRSGDGPDGSVVARFDGDLRPLGPPVPLSTAEDLVVVSALAVADDGTVYVAADSFGRLEVGDSVLLVFGPGSDRPRALPGYGADDLAVDGGDLWVLAPHLRLLRLDPADGSVEGDLPLCAEDSGDGRLAVADDGTVYAVGPCGGEEEELWVLEPSS